MNDFNLDRRQLLAFAGAAGLCAGAMPDLAAAQAAQAVQAAMRSAGSRPNLILWFPDEMRADALACYGNPVVKSPNFDLLARQGARFENCHVQYPVCGASRCSLLTGWPTSVRGHRSLYYYLRPDEPNMFRYLRQAGYDVFWFGKNDALAQQSFQDSVTEWHDAPARGGGAAGANLTQNTRPAPGGPAAPTTMLHPGGGDRRKTGDYALLQMAIEILERKESDKPFCIFLPLGEPHPPYSVPADFDTMYKPGDLPPLVPPNLPKKPLYMSEIRRAYGLDRVSDQELRQVRAIYYGQVSYADWLLGEMLQALERTGHDKDTAIMVGSDHGDYAGDYGLVEKWPSGLESCLTHVPFMARVPGGTSGVVRPEMVELYDIMPTFLELAGTKATHTHFARSLLPQIHGGKGDPDRCAFTEGGYNEYEPQAFEPPGLGGDYGPKTTLQNDKPDTISRCASVKSQRYTYVARPGGQSELYDRADDPHETRNLIDSSAHTKVLDGMKTRLLNWYVDTTGVPPVDRDPRNLPPFYRIRPHDIDDARRGALLDR